jgi:hypothetical protein
MPTHINIRAIALMMEATSTSGTLVNFYQTTRRYNPEDSIFMVFTEHSPYIVRTTE